MTNFFGLSVIGSVLIGCSGDTAGPATSVPAAYFSLVLNEHAINMAVTDPVYHSNTIQLTTTALDASGNPVPGAGQPTFTPSDSSVTVSPAGIMTALYPTKKGGTQVVARLQIGHVTHVDTAFVRVTASAPVARLATFSIQPALHDSAIRAFAVYPVPSTYTPTVKAKDTDSGAVSFSDPTGNSNFYVVLSSNPVIATPNSHVRYQLNDTGSVTFYAETWMYGVVAKDSLRFHVVLPLVQYVGVEEWDLDPGNLVLAIGGRVEWFEVDPQPDSIGLVFDDSTKLDSALDDFIGAFSGGGNIYFAPNDTLWARARQFKSAGTYYYHMKQYPTVTGSVIVMANSGGN